MVGGALSVERGMSGRVLYSCCGVLCLCFEGSVCVSHGSKCVLKCSMSVSEGGMSVNLLVCLF